MAWLNSEGRRLRFRKPTSITLQGEKRVVARRLCAARYGAQQARGLMGRQLAEGEALLFDMPRRERFSLHMWFVFHPIDVLFCDRLAADRLRVIEVKRSFAPFTLYRAKRSSDLFIELPAGATDGVRAGEELTLSRKIFKAGRRMNKR